MTHPAPQRGARTARSSVADGVKVLGQAGLFMTFVCEVLSWFTGADFAFLALVGLSLACIVLGAVAGALFDPSPAPPQSARTQPRAAPAPPRRPKPPRTPRRGSHKTQLLETSPQPTPPGIVPDDELTPEQRLVRLHFPGAVFETEEQKRVSAAASEERMSRYVPAARPRTSSLLPLDWRTAERSAAQWMQLNGYSDARLTPAGADGGVDVVSARAVAQVKHQQTPVGSAVIQQLRGATSTRAYQGRDALFFSSYGFTAPARTAARDMGVQLYQHDGDTWRRVL